MWQRNTEMEKFGLFRVFIQMLLGSEVQKWKSSQVKGLVALSAPSAVKFLLERSHDLKDSLVRRSSSWRYRTSTGCGICRHSVTVFCFLTFVLEEHLSALLFLLSISSSPPTIKNCFISYRGPKICSSLPSYFLKFSPSVFKSLWNACCVNKNWISCL